MKKLIISTLSILFIFSSCSKSKEKELNNGKYQRIWVNYKSTEKKEEIVEYYITKEKDSIMNQYKTFVNGNIDSTKSSFYKVELVKSKIPSHYNGIIKFYPKYKKELSNRIQKERSLKLLVFQENKDSLYTETFESNSKNEIKFELVNYKSDQLSGILTDLRFLEERNKDSLLVISYDIAVDNKLNTHNMGIEIFLKKTLANTVHN